MVKMTPEEREREIARIKLSIEIKESNIEVFQEKIRILRQKLRKLKELNYEHRL